MQPAIGTVEIILKTPRRAHPWSPDQTYSSVSSSTSVLLVALSSEATDTSRFANATLLNKNKENNGSKCFISVDLSILV